MVDATSNALWKYMKFILWMLQCIAMQSFTYKNIWWKTSFNNIQRSPVDLFRTAWRWRPTGRGTTLAATRTALDLCARGSRHASLRYISPTNLTNFQDQNATRVEFTEEKNNFWQFSLNKFSLNSSSDVPPKPSKWFSGGGCFERLKLSADLSVVYNRRSDVSASRWRVANLSQFFWEFILSFVQHVYVVKYTCITWSRYIENLPKNCHHSSPITHHS